MVFSKRSGKERSSKSLSMDLDEYYSKAYSNIASSGSFGLVSKWQHKQMETYPASLKFSGQRVLEVGAGEGQHIYFVNKDSWSEYVQTDLRPPLDLNSRSGSWLRDSIEASNLPFPDDSFDRLVSTCVLAHTDDPRSTLSEWRRVVRKNGVITIYLPSESSLLLSLLRHFGPKQARISAGFDPRIIFLDHRYNYRYLKTSIELEFRDCTIKTRKFPRWLPWWLGLWEILQIKI
jgi:ubiquinone/menaquinone biosynthesis C-methylase UbiE